jgi:hypothetical protein
MAKWPNHFISGKLFLKWPNGNHVLYNIFIFVPLVPQNRFSNFLLSTTECFTDLGKLNLLRVVQFLGFIQLILLPQLHLKKMVNLKVVKIDSK